MRIVNLLLVIVNLTLNNQWWNQLATWRRTFIESNPSHIKQRIGMKCKKGKINHFANQCEHIFGIGTCMMSSFKPQERGIYKQATVAGVTQRWRN